MVTYRFVDIDIPEAEKLADLEGIRQDFDATVSTCDLIIQTTTANKDYFRLIEALSSAALIRYSRPFSKGVRTRMPKMAINSLTEEQMHYHKHFIDVRDKHVAHSVNTYEGNQVVAYLVPEEKGNRGVMSVSVQHNRVISIGEESAKTLKELAAYFMKSIEELMDTEKNRLKILLSGMSMDWLYGLGTKKFAKDNVSGSRKKRQLTTG